MSDKRRLQNTLLSMGFPETYIIRAFKVYEKNYGVNYNLEVITEIIVRLQNKDNLKFQKDAGSKQKKKREKATKTNVNRNKNGIVDENEGKSESAADDGSVIRLSKNASKNVNKKLEPINSEIASLKTGLQALGMKLVEIVQDGNGLFRCLAQEILGNVDSHFQVRKLSCYYMAKQKEYFANFIPDFENAMKTKAEIFERADATDVQALSEFFNVRIQVYSYSVNDKQVVISNNLGQYSEAEELPLVLLALVEQTFYHLILDGNASHSRPLGSANERSETVSLLNLRLKNENQKLKVVG